MSSHSARVLIPNSNSGSSGDYSNRSTKPVAVKVWALKEVLKGELLKKQIAKICGIPSSTLSTWIRSSRAIFKAYERENQRKQEMRQCLGPPESESNPTPNTSRQALDNEDEDLKLAKHEDRLYDWYAREVTKGQKVTKDLLQMAAYTIADKMSIGNFVCSADWLDEFVTRFHMKVEGAGEKRNVTSTEQFHETENDSTERCSPTQDFIEVPEEAQGSGDSNGTDDSDGSEEQELIVVDEPISVEQNCTTSFGAKLPTYVCEKSNDNGAVTPSPQHSNSSCHLDDLETCDEHTIVIEPITDTLTERDPGPLRESRKHSQATSVPSGLCTSTEVATSDKQPDASSLSVVVVETETGTSYTASHAGQMLQATMASLWERDVLTDVNISTRTRTFHLHKVVWACHSPKFQCDLACMKKEQLASQLTIEVDCQEDAIMAVIEFMYLGNIELNSGNIEEIRWAATALHVDLVLQLCDIFTSNEPSCTSRMSKGSAYQDGDLSSSCQAQDGFGESISSNGNSDDSEQKLATRKRKSTRDVVVLSEEDSESYDDGNDDDDEKGENGTLGTENKTQTRSPTALDAIQNSTSQAFPAAKNKDDLSSEQARSHMPEVESTSTEPKTIPASLSQPDNSFRETVCCADCGMSFARTVEGLQSLIIHKKTVHVKAPFIDCLLCGKAYFNLLWAIDHVNNDHQMNQTTVAQHLAVTSNLEAGQRVVLNRSKKKKVS